MSRSRRKPIVKDRPRNEKKSSLYWRIVRRVINGKVRQIIKTDEDETDLPQPREIVNDYDYCDYVIDYRDTNWSEKHREYREKQKRK
jgi:hypothetical protein